MAWPVDAKHTTFVANVTTVTAAFLNEIQDRITHIFGGSRTLKKLSVDGAGDVASAAGNGEIRALNDIFSTGGKLIASLVRSSGIAGAGQSVAMGTVYKDTTVFAWARAVMSVGPVIGLNRGANILSVSRLALGKYKFTLAVVPTNIIVPVVTVADTAARMAVIDPLTFDPAIPSFEVWTYDAAGLLVELTADGALNVVVMAG